MGIDVTPDVTVLPSPFDDPDDVVSYATPSCCCCCCCCCVTTLTSTSAFIGREIANSSEASNGRRITFAWLTGILLVPGTIAAMAVFAANGDSPAPAGIASVGFLVALAIVFGGHSAAGSRPGASWVRSGAALVIAGLAAVGEVFLVLLSAGIFWLSIPFGIWGAIRLSDRLHGKTPTSETPPRDRAYISMGRLPPPPPSTR